MPKSTPRPAPKTQPKAAPATARQTATTKSVQQRLATQVKRDPNCGDICRGS
jgi:hypothetical protein